MQRVDETGAAIASRPERSAGRRWSRCDRRVAYSNFGFDDVIKCKL